MPDFSSKNEGRWFYFDDVDPNLGGVCLRELSTAEAANIEKTTVKIKRKPLRGNMMEVRDENTQLASKLTWDYCITDWKNVQLDSNNMECNAENKSKMMRCTDFAKFIGDCVEELVEINKTLTEARLKNSGTSSSGKLKNQIVKPVPISTKQ